MKFLLVVTLLGVVWWLWTKRPTTKIPPKPAQSEPEDMLTCSHCGVHLPESDAVHDEGRIFCGEAHRDAVRLARRR